MIQLYGPLGYKLVVHCRTRELPFPQNRVVWHLWPRLQVADRHAPMPVETNPGLKPSLVVASSYVNHMYIHIYCICIHIYILPEQRTMKATCDNFIGHVITSLNYLKLVELTNNRNGG